jgi:hypothetical protein
VSASSPPRAGSARELQSTAAALVENRPEVAAGAAFATGLLFAMILKRISR